MKKFVNFVKGNNIKKQNNGVKEAIRWYKNGKLITSNEPESSMGKDWHVIQANNKFYILTSYEYMKKINNDDDMYVIKNFHLLDSYYLKLKINVVIPPKIELNQNVRICEGEDFITIKLSDLSEDILNKISNL